MGAWQFEAYKEGTSLQEAFLQAAHEAAWESGHGGYTGTIAEKSEVELRSETVMTLKEAQAFAEGDVDNNEKWGPAFALKVKDEEREGFYFYGWASS